MKTDLANINNDVDISTADTVSADTIPLDLAAFAAARGVKHFLVSFSDLISAVLREALGEEFANSYLKLQNQQWRAYSSQVSAWELEHTLDC